MVFTGSTPFEHHLAVLREWLEDTCYGAYSDMTYALRSALAIESLPQDLDPMEIADATHMLQILVDLRLLNSAWDGWR